MKKKTVFILCVICFLLGSSLLIPGYFFFKCKTDDGGHIGHVEPGPELPPDPKPGVKNPYACGATINIIGAMREGKFFTTASNDCMTVNREFELEVVCPEKYYHKPYSIQFQVMSYVGYNKEIGKFNALIGGTLAFIWNYKYGSVGVGVSYLQGLAIPEYYGGLVAFAQVDFGKKKIVDNFFSYDID